jgi:hypothetical protein
LRTALPHPSALREVVAATRQYIQKTFDVLLPRVLESIQQVDICRSLIDEKCATSPR